MYKDTDYKINGVEKEDEHFPRLQKILEKQDLVLSKSTEEENKNLKVDYWAYQRKQYAFDFKTAKNPHKGFCLTYKIANSNKNMFEDGVGIENTTYIFLLEHKKQYAFVYKKNIKNWYDENKPKLHPGKKDDSNYFFFPTDDLEKMAVKIKDYEYE